MDTRTNQTKTEQSRLNQNKQERDDVAGERQRRGGPSRLWAGVRRSFGRIYTFSELRVAIPILVGRRKHKRERLAKKNARSASVKGGVEVHSEPVVETVKTEVVDQILAIMDSERVVSKTLSRSFAVSIPSGEGKTFLANKRPETFVDHDSLLDQDEHKRLFDGGDPDTLHKFHRSVSVPFGKILLTWGEESVPDDVDYLGAFLVCGCESKHRPRDCPRAGLPWSVSDNVGYNRGNRESLSEELDVFYLSSWEARDRCIDLISEAANRQFEKNGGCLSSEGVDLVLWKV